MKDWIIPANPRVFDIDAALAANQGLLDWRVKNVSEGDIVYIYKSRPDSCIRYMMEVVNANVPVSERLEQHRFWFDQENEARGDTQRARLSLVDVFDPNLFPLSALRQHGIKGNIQSKRECPPETQEYLIEKFRQ